MKLTDEQHRDAALAARTCYLDRCRRCEHASVRFCPTIRALDGGGE